MSCLVWENMQYRFQDPKIGKPMGLFPKMWENYGAILHKLGNIATCYSQFWKMKGTRNPHLGKEFS